jgi:hypothetical protein
MSQGTSPATTPGATTKKTALPTAAADRRILRPGRRYVVCGQ